MLKSKNLAVVAYTNFSRDSRVQKEAIAAAEIGFNIDVYSLKDKGLNNFKSFHFIKLNLKQYKGDSKFKYIFSYVKFFLYSFFFITLNYFKKHYKFIHFHNMPNFLVFSGIIPKLFGSKIILDIHDLIPELYSVKFKLNNSHPLIKILYLEEKISALFSNNIIATNNFHIERFEKNGFGHKNITQIVNIADESIFYPPEQKNITNGDLVIAYPSTLSKRLGIDDLIDAVEILHKKGIHIKLNIYGDGEYRSELVQIIKEKKLQDIIKLSDSFVTLENLSKELDKANIGVIPLPRNESNDIAMPVKIYEFFAKKICVIASDLPLLKSCFTDSVIFFEAGNSEDLAKKIEHLNNNRSLIIDFAEKGYKKFSSETWEYYKEEYQKIIS